MTGLIIAIVALLLIGAFVALFMAPKMRDRRRERVIQERRQEVAGAHHETAEQRRIHAEQMEQQARHARAEAELHAQKAELHERGMADHELVDHDQSAQGRFTRHPEERPTR